MMTVKRITALTTAWLNSPKVPIISLDQIPYEAKNNAEIATNVGPRIYSNYITKFGIIKLMSDQTDTINLLKPYGLSTEESRIYLYLLAHGFTSVLTISRELNSGRTKTYRLIDKLKKAQLVESKVDERGLKFGATHPTKLSQIIMQKESEISHLKNALPDVMSKLSALMQSTHETSKVLYYKGIDGLKQVSYNITNADKLLRVFEMEHLTDFLPADFAEMVREKLVEKKITTHDLTNKTSFPDFTKVIEMIKSYSEFRYIAKEKLSIDFEILIYNDVYATYTYKNNSIFCVEIYNPQLAQMQKQIFDFIWSQAVPMKFTSPYGTAELAS